MKRRGFAGRVTRVVIVAPAKWGPEKLTGVAQTRLFPAERKAEWLSEEEMPDRNVDGTPMVNGIDLNGRPYGRTAAWEDDPWQTGFFGQASKPGPLDTPWRQHRETHAAGSHVPCTVCLVVIIGYRRGTRTNPQGARPQRNAARFHRSASSRRARRWRREEASRHRRVACCWIALPLDAADVVETAPCQR